MTDDHKDFDHTDLRSHHIEGYARAAEERGVNGYFKVPLISHVEGNLYQGGCLDGVELDYDFVHVISLYPWEQYILGPDTHRLEVEMYDAGEMPNIVQLFEIAEKVNKFKAEGKTLVHCQAGLNRSGLVAALSLIMEGRKPDEAITLLRKSRCDMVLCNQTFDRWLRGQEINP